MDSEKKQEPQDSFPSLVIFGRDVRKIPCFNQTMVYGTGFGLAVGLLAFLRTSQTQKSANIGMGAFFVGSLSTWFYCRYYYYVVQRNAEIVRQVMQEAGVHQKRLPTKPELDIKDA